jgi:hypothetical protein
MSEELHELLSAWHGNEISDERRELLLTKLRHDADLRNAFVTEARTFAMLHAVQAAEPRWLTLQDELGISDHNDHKELTFENRLLEAVQARPRPFVAAWWRPLAALTAVAAAVFASLFFFSPPDATKNNVTDIAPAIENNDRLAVAVRIDAVDWDTKQKKTLQAGDSVSSGPLRFNKGHVTLAYISGVSVHIEGPADLVLVGPDRIICHQGNLRAKIVEGAEGFTIETPGAAIIDLGTEFGVHVDDGGLSQVVVYEGKAEASLLAADGTPRRTQMLSAAQSIELNPRAGTMRSLAPRELLPAPDLTIEPLPITKNYAQRVLAAGPLHYWRGENAQGDHLRDAAPGGMNLRIVGPIKTLDDGSLAFGETSEPQFLRAEGSWMPPEDFAIELWFASTAFHNSTLAVVQAMAPDHGDLAMVELTRRNPATPLRPGRVRFLYRWPPGGTDGVNLHSSPLYVPYRWQHLVCQRRGGTLEMYLDGEPVGETGLQGLEQTIASSIRFGRLNEERHSPNARQFQGRMAELAIYERALSHEEIQQHAQEKP